MIEFTEKPATFLDSLPVNKKESEQLLKLVEEYFDTNTVKKAYILTPSDYNITEFFNLFLNCLKEFYFKDNANEDICKALEKIKKEFNDILLHNYDIKDLKFFLIALISSYIKLVLSNENNNNSAKE